MRNTTRDRLVGLGTSAILLAAVGVGAVALGQARTAGAEPAAIVETEAPAIVVPSDAPNGAAAEQEAEAAALVEAQRVAAEQAAAAEAARVAAEQAAAEQAAPEAESFDEASDEGGEPAPEPTPPTPATEWDPNTTPHTVCEVLADGTPVPCQ